MKVERAAVVGGGIWGLSAAAHLAGRGVEVVLLERSNELAGETTPQAAGLVGQIRSGKVMTQAIRSSLELLESIGVETGVDPGFRRVGSLLVAFGSERMAAFQEQVRRATENGVEVRFVNPEEMMRLAPAIRADGIQGGYFIPGDGYVDPRSFALAYAALAKARGVDLRLGVEARGLAVEGGRVAGIETDQGAIPATTVVVAAGPWTGVLASRAGTTLPVQPIRHQRARTVPCPGIPDHHPVVRVPDLSCYVRPDGGGYTYGYFDPHPLPIDLEAEPASYRTADVPDPEAVLEEARRRLAPVFPVLADLAVAERRRGMTTFAPDGQYLIGPAEGIGGVWLAAGCAALGIAGSAAVGKWLADWIVDGRPGEDLSRFDPNRFGEKGRDKGWVRAASLAFSGNYYGIAPMTER